jgi:hypothetical protein
MTVMEEVMDGPIALTSAKAGAPRGKVVKAVLRFLYCMHEHYRHWLPASCCKGRMIATAASGQT